MALNPPFLLEDQTDEDFFDKLVNDDDDDVGFNVTTPGPGLGMSSSPGYIHGNDSDEVKAFANLSISDDTSARADNIREKSSGFQATTSSAEPGLGLDARQVYVDGNESDEVKAFANLSISGDGNSGVDNITGDKGVNCNAKTALIVEGNGKKKSGGSLVSLASGGSDGLLESSNGNMETEVTADKMENHTGGSGNSGVKEVGWSAFHADPVTNGDNSGFGSYMDFFSELGDNNDGGAIGNAGEDVNKGSTVVPADQVNETSYLDNTSSSLTHGQNGYGYDATTGQVADGHDLNSSQYWEDLYPGWKYDANTGQCYQVDSIDSGANAQGSTDSNLVSDWAVSDGTPEVSYLQQAAQSVSGNAAESVANWNQVSLVSNATENMANWNQASQTSDNGGVVTGWNQVSLASDAGGVTTDWNQASQINNGYPSHMVFDPQYPGWYYDMIALEWRSLESYTSSAQSTVQGEGQLDQTGLASQQTFSHNDDQRNYGHKENSGFQGFSSGGGDYNWSGSFGNYNQNSSNLSQNENVAKSYPVSEYRGSQKLENHYNQEFSTSSDVNRQMSNHYEGTVQYNAKAIQSQGNQGFFSGGGFGRQFSQPTLQQHEQKHASSDYYGSQTTASYSQQAFQSSQQFSHAPAAGRSSAGRPPHALVTFGFGGKLIVMKDNSSFGNQSFGSQESDARETAVAKLFASVKRNGMQFNQYGAVAQCLQQLPSEGQMRATAAEVQILLVSGRKKEALQVAQEGQLWGPALVLAAQLGEQFYGETVKQMALRQLVAGSPLRTLCLLIAGQPADVFSVDSTVQSGMRAVNVAQQPAQFGANVMLDDWEENLAVITANRTKDDELVLIHLGDCLWRERSDIQRGCVLWVQIT